MLSQDDLHFDIDTAKSSNEHDRYQHRPTGDETSITRLKRPHPKVRTGCLTCRKRRVKCDENRPACVRCQKGGRICEGYESPRTWLFEPSKQSRLPESGRGSRLHVSKLIQLFDDSQDNRAYQYFTENTAPRLSSYFSEMLAAFLDDTSALGWICGQNRKFWYGLVPRAATSDPAVKHSLLALSSLHEWTVSSSTSLWQNISFVNHYRQAVSQISKSSQTASLEVVLISCILFAHCEFVRGASAAGIAHIKAGLGIIDEQRQQLKLLGRNLPDVVIQEVEPILSGFGVKSEQYSLDSSEVGPHVMTDDKAYKLPDLPETFDSLLQASMTLLQIVYWVHILIELGRPGHLTTLHATVLLQADDWLTTFENWRRHKHPEIQADFHDWCLLLLAQHRMCVLILQTQPPENDVDSRGAEGDFLFMYTQLRSFMGPPHKLREISTEPQLLDNHIGIIAPLFHIATQSCSTQIRHDALDLLEKLDVKEGRWNSCVAYVIAKTIIELEEADDRDSRPGRIRVEGVEVKPNHTLELRYTEFSSEASHKKVVYRKVIDESFCSAEEQREWSLSRLTKLDGLQGSVRPTALECHCRNTK